MNGNAHGPDPIVRKHLAMLVPAPTERDLPGDRQRILREAFMREITITTAQAQPANAARSPRRRARLAAAGSLTAAGAVAVSMLTGLFAATPAWAVETGPGDTITVRINEFSDPEGLEARLEAEGVPAIVDYIPANKGCTRGGEPRTLPEGERGRVISRARVEDGATVFHLQRGELGDGAELSILAIIAADQNAPVSFTIGVLPAPAQHCEITDTPMVTK